MLLNLIEDIFLKGISSRSEQMKDRIKLFAKTNSPRNEDAELVSYNGWLSGKLKARTSP
jgi:hypothetical protein